MKKIMKNNDKNVKSFERAKKKGENVELENSDTALQLKSVHSNCAAAKTRGGKPEKSMNKNGTESRTYFMLLSIDFNPPPFFPFAIHKMNVLLFSFIHLQYNSNGGESTKTTHMLLPGGSARGGNEKLNSKKVSFFSFFRAGQYFSIFCHFNSDSIYLLSITKIENTEESRR